MQALVAIYILGISKNKDAMRSYLIIFAEEHRSEFIYFFSLRNIEDFRLYKLELAETRFR